MEPSQNADIYEQMDDGIEVTSPPPGAPVKAPRPPPTNTELLNTIARNLNPLLAECAVMVNDPDQTKALADFAEGKLSYAEMRARCG